MVYKLLPNEAKELELEFSLNVFKNLSKPYKSRTTLEVTTSEEKVIEKEIDVRVLSPKIELLEAILIEDNLNITIINSGDEDIRDLKIELFDEVQEIKEIKQNEVIKKVFVLKEDIKKFDFEVYKEGVSGFSWKFEDVEVIKPIIKLLSQNPNKIYDFEFSELEEVKRELLEADKFELIGIEGEFFDRGVEFFKASIDKRAFIFAKLFEAKGKRVDEFYSITLPSYYELSLDNFLPYFDNGGDIDKLINRRKKIFIISFDKKRQNLIYEKAKDRSNLLIAPNQEKLLKLFFLANPHKILSEILSEQLNFRDISPYQINDGVVNEVNFFGRIDLVSQIFNKNLANYLIVGGRQIGKSSILKKLQREYNKNSEIDSFYITLRGDDVIKSISNELQIENSLEKIEKYIYKSKKKILFLLDEVDEFILKDIKNSYKITNFFRKVSQEDRAYFIMAGFWHLFYSITKDYQSPLKNFGEIIKVEELEYEACRELMIEPMKRIKIGYESEELIDFVIKLTGQRANLIAVICNEVLKSLKSKIVTKKDIDMVLKKSIIEDYIGGWGKISGDEEKYENDNRLDRIIIFSTLKKESFRLSDIGRVIKESGLKIQSHKIEESLNRLVLSFILKEEKKNYSYRVPLFREKLLEDDIEFKLESEIDFWEE